jgi:predicted Zn-dependent protease
MRLRRFTVASLAAVCTIASAGEAVAQARTVGLRPDAATDEGGLWDISDKAEQHVRMSAELDKDPALDAYVHEVMCKVAAAHCGDIRVYVLDRPFLNAQVAPNGYAEVWSGLLLRAADEAELAFVLGHETTHFVENHSIERQRAHREKANVALAFAVAVSVVGAVGAAQASTAQEAQNIVDATRNLVDVIYLGSLAAIFSFTREQESQADDLGLKRAAAAGYDAAVAPRIWQAVLDEQAASDFPKVRKSSARASIFDTHPLETVRLAALTAEARTLPVGGAVGRERHRAAIRPHLAAWIEDDLRRKDFGETLFLLDRLSAEGEDIGVLAFYRGEAYRLRRGDGDAARAAEAYLKAVAYPDAPVAAWRELGDLRSRAGDAAGARTAYESYLAKAPEVEDAWIVRDALTTLSKGS